MILSVLVVMYLVGFFAFLVSEKLRIPAALFLLAAGILLSRTRLPESFFAAVAILAMIIVLFDSISKLREFDSFSRSTMGFLVLVLLFCGILISALLHIVFGIDDIYLAVLASVILCGTDPLVVGGAISRWSKAREFLKVESLLITPLIILIPSIILEIRQRAIGAEFIAAGTITFLVQILLGIGVGVIISIILMKDMKKDCSPHLSLLVIISAAAFTYVAAEMLGGNGILAVTGLGVIFGSRYLKGKKKLSNFAAMFAYALSILVFFSLGMNSYFSTDAMFLLKVFLLYLIYVLLRLLALHIAFRRRYTIKQALFISLNSPKGLSVGVICLALAVFIGNAMLSAVLLAFILYSIIVAGIVTVFHKVFE